MTAFNVSWKSGDKAVTGRAFAKKRKSSNVVSKPAEISEIEDKKVANVAKSLKSQKNVNKKMLNKSLKKSSDDNKDKVNDNKNDSKNKSSFVIKKNKQIKSKIGKQEVKSNLSIVSKTNSTPKLIKRKNKKEKAAAKLLAAQQSSNTATTSKVSENFETDIKLVFPPRKQIYIRPDTNAKSVVEKVFSKEKYFKDLNIHKYIVSNLEKINFTKLTNVQEKSIPVVLSGKNVLVRSQTGSGKTLAYAVPILNALQSVNPKLQRGDGVQVVIIVPTRELVMQTHEIFGKINTFQWLIVGYLCGGENRNTEKARLRKGVHILISTPGRLLDHLLHTMSFKIDKVKCLVLDEADRLLDMGFKKDIVSIVEELDKAKSVQQSYDPMALLKGKNKNVDDKETVDESEMSVTDMPLCDPNSKFRQTLLLSATLSKGVAELADFAMKDHTYIDALEESSGDISPDLLVIPNTVKQKFVITQVKHRLSTLSEMLLAQAENASKVFVFMGTSIMVDFHYELFTKHLVKMPKSRGKLKSGDVVLLEGVDGSDVEDDEEESVIDVQFFKLHGNMEQSARKEVFTKFRAAKAGVLICTDVVARGIDVPTADCVIQYNGPQSVEDYLHRVGRTGRAGKSGVSYIFLTHEEQNFVTELEKHKIYLKEENLQKFSQHLCVLMEENDHHKAAVALRRHYETAVSNDKELHKLACLAYSSWARFYNTYSKKVRSIFDFKNVNLGHYLSSFAVKETPSEVSKIVKGQVSKIEPPKLNKKLALHEDEQAKKVQKKRKIKSISLTTSEFSSGLEPKKKKRKKEQQVDN